MFFDNKKKSQNGIEKRVFILKQNFSECNNQNVIQKFAWSSLQNLSYTQNDNIITISSEQSQKNKAADMVQFIAKMGAASNFEKIIYFLWENIEFSHNSTQLIAPNISLVQLYLIFFINLIFFIKQISRLCRIVFAGIPIHKTILHINFIKIQKYSQENTIIHCI